MNWDKVEEIFPYGGVEVDGDFITWDQIRKNNYSRISSYLLKPIRSGMLEYVMRYTWYPDGNVKIECVDSVFKDNNVDDIPLLNIYGQKVYNNILEEVVGQQQHKSIITKIKLFFNNLKIKMARK